MMKIICLDLLIKNLSYIFFLFFLQGCDFTSNLNREILLAQDLIESHRYKEAAEVYVKILQKNSSKQILTKIHYQLGNIYYLYLNQQEKALVNFKYIVENDNDPKNQVKAIERIADINFTFFKNFSEAAKNYKILLNFSPKLNDYDFYEFRHTVSLFELMRFSESESKFKEFIANTNHVYHVESFYYLGLQKFYESKWDESVVYWLEYIKREKRKDLIVKTKFLIANAYESGEKLKEAYNIYYSLLEDYPNPEIIKNRIKSLYARRVARKR